VLALAWNGIGMQNGRSEIDGRAIIRVTGAIIQNKEAGVCENDYDTFYLARIF